MTRDPYLIVVGRVVRMTIGDGIERRKGLFHGLKPGLIAALDRAAQRQAFDVDAGAREIFEIGRRHRADPKAGLVRGLHQAVGGQPRQGLAHCRKAHRKLLCQTRDVEFLAGNKLCRKDVGAKALQHGGGQGSRSRPSVRTKTDRNTVHGGEDDDRAINRQSKIDFLDAYYCLTGAPVTDHSGASALRQADFTSRPTSSPAPSWLGIANMAKLGRAKITSTASRPTRAAP